MSNTFCPLLFQHLATHPHGGVTHCCVADHRNALSSSRDGDRFYNLNRDTVHDTMNSESYKKARLEVLDGKKPKACLRCFAEEAKGMNSKRVEEIKNYPEYTIDVAREVTDSTGYMKDVQLEFVELRLGNTCNVACRTCNPASSSKWRNDYDKLQNATTFKLTDYNTMEGFRWPERTGFWEDLLQHCDKVKTFYINGGEPMLSKEHFAFLQRLVDMGKTDIKLWYNINMTLMNEKVIDLWRKFDHVKISCSIDDLGDRNHYIRYPTKWNDVEKNIMRLKKEKFEMDITQTVSWMNYSTLGDFYNEFHNKHGIFVHHNYVYDPDVLSPAVLPKAMRENIHKNFEGVFDEWKLKELKTMFGGPDKPKKWEQAKEYTRNLDEIRNQDIENFLPEFKGKIS
ncbi:MAG: twitch domain-containing radical SAM protein [Rhodobacteraceae bacterium]|nr:twitch domain-containing radical SAM protein [Paracoccaceae bacterium]